jgi:hypothetical protein
MGDPVHRPVLGPQLGTQGTDHPDRGRLLFRAVPPRPRLPKDSLTRHGSILVSKVRSLHETQCDSVAVAAPVKIVGWSETLAAPYRRYLAPSRGASFRADGTARVGGMSADEPNPRIVSVFPVISRSRLSRSTMGSDTGSGRHCCLLTPLGHQRSSSRTRTRTRARE